MEEFAEEKEAWLREFLGLPNGIPSHDTLSTLLERVDPKSFQEAFLRWLQAALTSDVFKIVVVFVMPLAF